MYYVTTRYKESYQKKKPQTAPPKTLLSIIKKTQKKTNKKTPPYNLMDIIFDHVQMALQISSKEGCFKIL